MPTWNCTHRVITIAHLHSAWNFLSDLTNHAELDPGIDRIELDGPFTTGTIGRTISGDVVQDWVLAEVVPDKRLISGVTPDHQGLLSFAWHFKEAKNGCMLTYEIAAFGPEVSQHLPMLEQMKADAFQALSKLVKTLDGQLG